MGSRSYIGYLNKDGNVTASYCHLGAKMDINGKSLLTHYNTDENARAIAYHGEMASIDGDTGKVSEYKNPAPTISLSLNAFLTYSERNIQSIYLWRNFQWYVKSDYYLDNEDWHIVANLLEPVKIGDNVNLNRDAYITSQPRPVWEVKHFNQDNGVYRLTREVLPNIFLTEHMRRHEFYLCPSDTEKQTPAQLSERQQDLQSRISKLCELSAKLEHYYEKLKDDDSDLESLEQQYQDLFSETVLEFGN
ncbi:MAG: hypothetical protein OXU23_03605 [Candidatus Poribacteria bacterium]|nr:hypothetical protein [Candidatus Poribacteria bacterium]